MILLFIQAGWQGDQDGKEIRKNEIDVGRLQHGNKFLLPIGYGLSAGFSGRKPRPEALSAEQAVIIPGCGSVCLPNIPV